MSTRSSMFYKHGIHLFVETKYSTICCDWPEDCETLDVNRDAYYQSFTMPLDDWEEFTKSLLKHVDGCRKTQEKWNNPLNLEDLKRQEEAMKGQK